jgi:hypothetical protein
MIAPFVLLSFFNHPQNDDYVIAAQVVTWGSLRTFVFWYKAWTPRYFAIAGSTISPAVFKAFFVYKLMAALTIGLTLLSTYLLARELTRGAFTRGAAFLGALAITAVYLFRLPAPAQSLYWFNGSLCYQYGGILLASGFALAMRARTVAAGVSATARDRRRFVRLSAGAALLLIAAAGTNELTLICEVEIVGIIVVLELWRRRAVRGETLWLVGAAAIASAAVFLSPGMWLRHQQAPHSLGHSVTAAIESTACHLGTWLFATPLLPVFAMVFAHSQPQGERILPFRLHPAVAFVGSLGILFPLFFIPLYGAESAEERVVASIYFMFLVLFFVNLCAVIDHLQARCGREALTLAPTRGSSFATLVLATLLCVLPASTARTAYADLLSGRTYRFDRQMMARYRTIRSCAAAVCEVPPLEDWPSTIKFFDDAYDPRKDDAFFTTYKRAFAGFFGKTMISVKP